MLKSERTKIYINFVLIFQRHNFDLISSFLILIKFLLLSFSCARWPFSGHFSMWMHIIINHDLLIMKLCAVVATDHDKLLLNSFQYIAVYDNNNSSKYVVQRNSIKILR